jgi:intein-encoded DNA endonuclease-like protein
LTLRGPLPLVERQEIFMEISRIKQSKPDLGPAELRRVLSSRFKQIPSRETIRRWNAGETSPMTGVNEFKAEPSEELSFFLGAWLGDGWGDDSGGGKRLLLKVRSLDFANEFANTATLVLNKTEPYLARSIVDEKGQWYQVKVTSVLLFELANRPFAQLSGYIKPHPTGFLRAFLTAEGNPAVSINASHEPPTLGLTVCVSNTELGYVQYALDLMKGLGYHPTKITIGDRPGVQRTIGGYSFTTTKTEWQFRIARIAEVENFLARIGFADSARQEKAETALSLIREYGSHRASVAWTEMYEKIGRKWQKKSTA